MCVFNRPLQALTRPQLNVRAAPVNAIASTIPASAIPASGVQASAPCVSAQSPIVENSTYARPANNQISNASVPSGAQDNSAQVSDSQNTLQQQQGQEEADDKATQNARSKPDSDAPFTELELKEIDSLKLRDSEVLRHEIAHAAVGGKHTGPPSYSYKNGPDGVKYAVSGEVSIDTSKVANDPQATLQKAQQIKAAALAPAEPSGQDRRVAATAEQMAAQARNEILQENPASSEVTPANINPKPALSEYFTGRQYLSEDIDIQEQLHKRTEHISSVYENSSVTKSKASLQIQV